MHNSIKLGTAERSRYIGWFKDTLRHLARAGISTICYNFMPVLDWTRTDLMFPLPTGGFALRFDAVDFAAYDLFVLKRPRVGDSYSGAQIETARRRFAGMTQETVDRLERNLIAGLPARERSFSREQLLLALGEYDGIGPDDLRANLAAFLREIIPVAEELGCRLCIHPDDPPFPLYGLPRIVSTSGDLQRIFDMYPANANGLTLCTGSLGAHPDNDLAEMARLFGPRIHFAHLRSVEREGDGSFVESEHLAGSSDLVAVIAALLNEQRRRQAEGARTGAFRCAPITAISSPTTSANRESIPATRLLAASRGSPRFAASCAALPRHSSSTLKARSRWHQSSKTTPCGRSSSPRWAAIFSTRLACPATSCSAIAMVC